MKILIIIVISFLLLLTITASGEVYDINSHDFDGFEKCELKPAFVAMTKKLFKEGKPTRREDNALFYNIKSEVMGISVKTIVLGICDGGSQDCGWGTYVAVIVAKPISELKAELKKKTGIDFTKELRAKESEETLRPVLTSTQNANESALICDPGGL